MGESAPVETLWTTADWQEARTAKTSLTRLLTTPSNPMTVDFEAQLVEVLDTAVMRDQRLRLESHGPSKAPDD